MVELIRAKSRMQAWLGAARFIRNGNRDANIVLEILEPLRENVDDVGLADWLDAFYRDKDKPDKRVHSLHTVAEYIFPAWEYVHHGFDGVFNHYPIAYDAMRRADPFRWGTYAYRMMRVQLPDGSLAVRHGEPINPLADVLKRMQRVMTGEGSPAYACYELNMWYPWRDRNTRGLPCLTHVSFKLLNGAVHVTAMYRNHDYAYKAPGNLLGLARLQAAVANHVHAEVGPLVIHSTRSFFDKYYGALGEFYNMLEARQPLTERPAAPLG